MVSRNLFQESSDVHRCIILIKMVVSLAVASLVSSQRIYLCRQDDKCYC